MNHSTLEVKTTKIAMIYTILSGSIDGFSDSKKFIDSLPRLATSVPLGEFLWNDRELIVTRAPGRLDVMGGIADYSGSLVLQLPIAAAAHAALQKNNSNRVRVASVDLNNDLAARVFEMRLDDFVVDGKPIEYETARRRFEVSPQDRWAAYVVGAVLVLMRQSNVVFPEGFDILISSAVPEGKGVSSSAALEVSAMNAIVAAFEIDIRPVEIALACQMVENLIAGAACGVMDQMTSEAGEENQLLELLCQPCVFLGTLAIPDELEFWGLDSGIKHSVGGSSYTTVRTAAFMGYRIIAELEDLVTGIEAGQALIMDPKWDGYLANITPHEFDLRFAALIPESMSGQEFLEDYGGISDSVTTVDPNGIYKVYDATRHPIYENHRVNSFAQLLRQNANPHQLGELMRESHLSYSWCGLGSRETDLIVDLVRDLADDLYGARITGGGSGGTVAILGQRGALASVERIAHEYENRSGNVATIISGSSPGAHSFQHIKLNVR